MSTSFPQSFGDPSASSVQTASAEAASSDKQTCSQAIYSTCSTTAKRVQRWIETRGGLAVHTGALLVPSKRTQVSDVRREAHLEQVRQRYVTWEGQIAEGLSAMIIYPKDWKEGDRSRCVVFNNPNGMIIHECLEQNGLLTGTPGQVAELFDAPILLYDYRGTGANAEVMQDSTSTRFHPSDATLVQDGEQVLRFAAEHFDHIYQWGTSLGGGVATIALDAYLKKHPSETERFTLLNHDSFTKTSRVMFSAMGPLFDFASWLGGIYLNAKAPMDRLVQKHKVDTLILCHDQDFLIPEGARMGDKFVQDAANPNLRVFHSSHFFHGALTPDMLEFLKAERG